LETGELQASEQKPAKVSPDEEKIFSLPKPRFGFLLHLSKRAAVIICLLLFVLIFAPILFIVRNNPASHSGDGRTVPDPISVISQDGTLVGMSDGRYVFDTNRTDGTTKLAAAEQMRKKNFVGASQLFEAASKNDPGDAEALIYREDLRVLASQRPYITLVVTTVFSANDVPISQATLQGAYVAQKEFNDGFKLHNNYQVYLLIANSVSGQKNASTTVKVAQQIVTLSQKDKTFFAMVGWPYSVDMQAALPVLKQHTIPVVSAIASSDALSGSSPYFFRTCPTNTAYGIAGANYSINTLHAKRAVIFVDPHDSYSGTLADAFKKQFEADGGVVVRTENYTARDPSTIPPLSDIPANLAYDLIYFSGIASDISAFLTNLPPGNVPIMGGSGSYLLGDYRESALPQLTRLHFTSPAYPDEWTILGLDAYTPAFFREYPHDFDPSGKSPNAYGHGRPTYESILAYDGMLALLTAANNALADPDHRLLSPQNVRWGLTQINQQHPLAGASGQIAFDVHGDPVDKAILSVHVVQDGSSQFFKMDSLIQGKLS
jgi:ABC-type branched-subunit amino acid transport system substrate-binding protein